MGFSRKRIGRDGKPRYTAYYVDVRDRERSAGTFTTKTEANKAWQKAEAELATGRIGDPRRGRMTFQHYVEETWLPNHQVELSTRGNYKYSIYKHIMAEFGPMRMIDILPEHVRAWITKLQETTKRKSGKEKISAATIKYNKDVLSAIFTTAFNDQVIYLHPCRGVKVPPIPPTQFTIVTPEQFELIYQALPDADAQLLVETDIESGLRWGELTELRVKDIDFTTRIVTLSRVVVELPANVRLDGERFVVKEYPKDRKSRRYKLSTQIIEKLRAHKDSENLGRDDLLFAIREQEDKKTTLRIAPNPDELGLTEPNEKGRQYKHGTMSGYGPGKCRCQHCRAACAIYRAERRAQGKDRPPKGGARAVTTDGHIPNNWFRNHVWYGAIEAARLGFPVRPHDLRHAHASWLLAGGADLQVVKERLGHGSIATTERYLHTLPEADETALDALSSIRNRSAAK